MSENYRFYVRRMAELRVARQAASPLRRQLIELLEFVLECEARWYD